MKTGLFFGSFNPIHIGHLIIANVMAEQTDLEKVCFVVSPQNPFKKNKNLAHEFDRLDMVRAAIDDNPRFEVSDIEFRMPKPSYTADTLAYLREKFPTRAFVLILGEDNLEGFMKWKNPQSILENHELYAYPRPYSAHSVLHEHAKVKMVQAPLLDISATYIRQCVKEGKSIRYLVHPETERIILSRKIYL